MNRIVSVVGGLLVLSGLFDSALAVDVTLNPSPLGWSEQRWVDITVSNLPSGGQIELELFVDVDGNHSVASSDVLLMHLPLQDGVTNALGATVMPSDNEGQTNGSYHPPFVFRVLRCLSPDAGGGELSLAREGCSGR